MRTGRQDRANVDRCAGPPHSKTLDGIVTNRIAFALKWLPASLATAGTVFIVYEAATIPFLRGAGLAQADLELFVVLLVVGIPALLVAAAVLLFAWFHARRHTSVSITRWLAAEPLGLVCVANIAAIAIAWGFLMYIRAFGLQAVRL